MISISTEWVDEEETNEKVSSQVRLGIANCWFVFVCSPAATPVRSDCQSGTLFFRSVKIKHGASCRFVLWKDRRMVRTNSNNALFIIAVKELEWALCTTQASGPAKTGSGTL